jgi:hypothetical protein
VGSQALVENDCDLKRINQTLELSAGFEVAVRNAGSLIMNKCFINSPMNKCFINSPAAAQARVYYPAQVSSG